MTPLAGTKGRLLFVLLVAAWILPGTVARSPWKADEAYTYGLVNHIMQSGDWVVPMLGGEPFMQKPPVIFVTAAICGKLFGGLLGLDTALRLSVVIFQVLTLVFLGIAGRELLGPGKGWHVPVVFMGCLGFVELSHMLICDVSLVSGVAVAFAGLLLTGRRPVVGGIILGTGAGIAFMSKGLLGPGLIGLTAMLLPFCGPSWRSKQYLTCLAVAAVASLPWVLIWPITLYQRSPELFKQWFLDNNLARFIGAARVNRPNALGLVGERYNFFVALPWYAFPAFPLACLAFWKERRAAWRQPGVQLGVVGLLVMLVILSLSRNSRTLYGLSLLVPASLLGARGVGYVTSRWTNGIRRSTWVLYGIPTAIFWVLWVAQFIPGPIQKFLKDKLPDYTPLFQFWAFAFAVAATALWLWWMRRQPRDDDRAVAINWCAGLSLCYLLAMTLFLPMFESDMSYRHLAPLREIVASRVHGDVISTGLGEPQRAMFDYYCGLNTIRLEVRPDATADWFLTETDALTPEGRQLKAAPWKLEWESVHSRKELFRLYHRETPTAMAALNRP